MSYLQLKFQATSQLGDAAYYVTERNDKLKPRTLPVSVVPEKLRGLINGRKTTYFLARTTDDGGVELDCEDKGTEW